MVFTALSWAVSMTLYALQQGLSLRFANQAVALVCGIFGSFVGLMALLFPVWVQRCVPWGYYGLLSLVRMEWDEATRWTAFFGGGRSPWIWPSCACGRPSFSLWDGLCSSERRYEAWYCAVSGRS
ncbi:ABC transporter permease [Flavonifractor plautii]|nr:ABC transporter permease [Flavonifractor plautii]